MTRDTAIASIHVIRDHIYLSSALFALGAVAVTLVLNALLAPTADTEDKSSNKNTDVSVTAGLNPVVLLILSIFLVFLFNVLEEFTYYDDDIFFGTINGAGQHYDPPIWADGGRFFPLAHQEWELISYFFPSGLAYRSFAALQFVLVFALVLLAREVKSRNWPWVASGLLILTCGPIFTSFGGLIFPERNQIMLFLLAFVLLSFFLYNRSNIIVLCSGVAASARSLLYKETAFVFPLCVGAALILHSFLSDSHEPFRSRQRIVGLSLLIPVATVLVYYFNAIKPLVTDSYLTHRSVNPISVLRNAATEVWFWALACLSIGRFLELIVERSIRPMWDGLLVGAIMLVCVYSYLGLSASYYFAPVAVFTYLYAAHFICGYVNARPYLSLGVALTTLLLAAQIPETFSSFVQRKEVVYSKAAAAQFLADNIGVEGRSDKVIRIYAPLVSAYVGGLFANFIVAKYGMNIELAIDNTEGWPESTPCINLQPVRCSSKIGTEKFAVSFSPGDLPPAGYHEIFRSAPIGQWHNQEYSRVFAKNAE